MICSPYAGDIARNTEIARHLMRLAIEHSAAPFAPHLLYPQVLDEAVPAERQAGIACGLSWLAVAEELWVYTPDGRVTPGMALELAEARRLGIPVRTVVLPGGPGAGISVSEKGR